MSVTLTIQLESLAQTGVLIDALRHEVENVASTLRYYERQAAEPFTEDDVEPVQEARVKHDAKVKAAERTVAEYTPKLALARSVWASVAGQGTAPC